jgi:TolB-like protein
MLRRLLVALAVLVVPLAALPLSAAPPVLVVYPFAVSGSTPDDLGSRVSAKIAAEVTALGGVSVNLGAATAKPADYRAAARAAGADLYFSGSILPVGTNFSAIENLVSTHSGTVVWSKMFQFRNVDDIAGQGAQVRDALMHDSATPTPGTAAAGLDLITPAPMSGFAVLTVTGSAADDDRAIARQAIIDTLQQRGSRVVTASGSAAADPTNNSVALCTTTGVRTLIWGTLDTTRVATGSTTAQTTAHISLQTYDCQSHSLSLQPTIVNHIAPAGADAIRGAVQDAISAFPAPS